MFVRRLLLPSLVLVLLFGSARAQVPADMSTKACEDFTKRLDAELDKRLADEYADDVLRIEKMAEPLELNKPITIIVIRGTHRGKMTGVFRALRGSGAYASVALGDYEIPFVDIDPLDVERLKLGTTPQLIPTMVKRMRDELKEKMDAKRRIWRDQALADAGYTEAFFRNTVDLNGRFHYLSELGDESIRLTIRIPAVGDFATARVEGQIPFPNAAVLFLNLNTEDKRKSYGCSIAPATPKPAAKTEAADKTAEPAAAKTEKPPEPAAAKAEPAAKTEKPPEPAAAKAEPTAKAEKPAEPAAAKAEPAAEPAAGKAEKLAFAASRWTEFNFRIFKTHLADNPERQLAQDLRLWVVAPGKGSWYLKGQRLPRSREAGGDSELRFLFRLEKFSVRPFEASMSNDFEIVGQQAWDYRRNVETYVENMTQKEQAEAAARRAKEEEAARLRQGELQKQEARNKLLAQFETKYSWATPAEVRGNAGGLGYITGEFRSLNRTDNANGPMMFDEVQVRRISPWFLEDAVNIANREEHYEILGLQYRVLELGAAGAEPKYIIQYALSFNNSGNRKLIVSPTLTMLLPGDKTIDKTDRFSVEPSWFGTLLSSIPTELETLLQGIQKMQVRIGEKPPAKPAEGKPADVKPAAPAPATPVAPPVVEKAPAPAANADGKPERPLRMPRSKAADKP